MDPWSVEEKEELVMVMVVVESRVTSRIDNFFAWI